MYKLTTSTSILRADGASIPADQENTDYSAYLQWLAEGNTPEPADLPSPPDYLAQIDALERQQLMPRATREFMLMFMEASATPEQLALNPGYKAVKAFDAKINALRAKIK
jgi:hypothetical protein